MKKRAHKKLSRTQRRAKLVRTVPRADHQFRVLSREGFSAQTRAPGERGSKKGPYPASSYEPTKKSVCGTDRVAAARSCPVTLGFVKGQPVVRGCFAKEKPGPIVHVDTVADAVRVSAEMCEAWKRCGTFDPAKCKPMRKHALGSARVRAR